ncbi:MAG: 2-C-methyl-D-erythritol 4-phosphate cytidylyltransferase [Chitinophagales bacterium]|nr:2-C-methyl-D-erythritol 4-phosphate cytidylyltransferase [Chitinophagales bacterium]MDW8427461.1 2-C-methyl-D-erythritol 4-phosphate cytidylyltransferase [Chitinophagales bacterium]
MSTAEPLTLYVVIAAGGYGSRMNSSVPKQFLPLNGKPLMVHTLQRIHACWPDALFFVALAEEHFSQWKKLRKKYLSQLNITEVKGGATRFHSVKNCLRHLRKPGIVVIHDACRPLVSKELLQRCLNQALRTGCAVPVVDVQDSLRELLTSGSRHRSRSRFRLVQTPQCFDVQLIKDAYQQTFQKEFTDDASVLEAAGGIIHLIDGEPSNMKITTPLDLMVAEKLIAAFPGPE